MMPNGSPHLIIDRAGDAEGVMETSFIKRLVLCMDDPVECCPLCTLGFNVNTHAIVQCDCCCHSCHCCLLFFMVVVSFNLCCYCHCQSSRKMIHQQMVLFMFFFIKSLIQERPHYYLRSDIGEYDEVYSIYISTLELSVVIVMVKCSMYS